jgi:hypothetical protein
MSFDYKKKLKGKEEDWKISKPNGQFLLIFW